MVPAESPLADVIQAVGSTERPAADDRFEATRQGGCSVAPLARDHCAPVVPHDSAPVGLEPADVAAVHSAADDSQAEREQDDRCAPVAVGWAAFLPADCWAQAERVVPGWAAARSAAAGYSAEQLADDRSSLVVDSALLAEVDCLRRAGLKARVGPPEADSRLDDLRQDSRADSTAHSPVDSPLA